MMILRKLHGLPLVILALAVFSAGHAQPAAAATSTKPHTHRIIGTQPHKVSMKVGDVLYVWEPGDSVASYQPYVIPTYLQLFAQGQTPPRSCPQPDCAQGFFWKYRAIQRGKTIVGLSAACRLVKPACMIPDIAIPVRIKR